MFDWIRLLKLLGAHYCSWYMRYYFYSYIHRFSKEHTDWLGLLIKRAHTDVSINLKDYIGIQFHKGNTT